MERGILTIIVAYLGVIFFVICFNWYTGWGSYSDEYSTEKQIDYSFEEGKQIATQMGVKFQPDKKYFSKETFIIKIRRGFIPFDYVSDTLHKSGKTYYRDE